MLDLYDLSIHFTSNSFRGTNLERMHPLILFDDQGAQ
jgi:hypothetical protein